jgi:Na+/melibiose symporter-like transporter
MGNQLPSNGKRSEKRFASIDYFRITILGFALTALWSSLHSIILPIRLLAYVPESQKNTYLGLLTFTGLVIAMFVQPIAGACSDFTNSRWGRRQPYILLGMLFALILLPEIGIASNYIAILVVYCFLQVSTNTAQASYQAFIPELVPANKRGLASGVKSIMEVLGGVALVRLAAYFMGRYFTGGGEYWIWITLGALMAVTLIATIVTVLTVKESPSTCRSELSLFIMWQSFKIDLKVHRDFVWFLFSRALLGIPGVALQIFALYYLKDVVGIPNPASAAGNLLLVVGICLLAATYPAGRLSDLLGRKPIVIGSGILGAVSIMILYFSRNYSQIMLAGALLGVANGALLSGSWALATDLARSGNGEEAKYLGLTNLAMAGGSALARLIGPVIDFFNGMNQGLGYQVMLMLCFISFIAGTIFIGKIKMLNKVLKES